ncbi:TIGR02444 family protein [Alkalilacustris brevis]|uniref:TIGR02444 family protein n=1 Tax=Alkalilacustris brevis TaxID=2026338 RepID=UPI000E0D540B|nr:TIGR02444 family protein [Alkalilacustris brevis]
MTGQQKVETGRFWAFSLKFYDSPEVQEACLALQDEGSADVNLALYLLFRARDGVAFDAASVAQVDAAVAGWRDDVVVPLRSLRRKLKPSPFSVDDEGQQKLRNQIKKAELEAERLEQFHLEARFGRFPGQPMAPDMAARTSLAALNAHLGGKLPERAVAALLNRFSV